MGGRTVEEIRNPDVHTDLFGEVVCNNPRIWQRQTEDVREEDDCLCPLCGIGIVWRCRKVVWADHGTLGLTREGKALVAIRATHG